MNAILAKSIENTRLQDVSFDLHIVADENEVNQGILQAARAVIPNIAIKKEAKDEADEADEADVLPAGQTGCNVS